MHYRRTKPVIFRLEDTKKIPPKLTLAICNQDSKTIVLKAPFSGAAYVVDDHATLREAIQEMYRGQGRAPYADKLLVLMNHATKGATQAWLMRNNDGKLSVSSSSSSSGVPFTSFDDDDNSWDTTTLFPVVVDFAVKRNRDDDFLSAALDLSEKNRTTYAIARTNRLASLTSFHDFSDFAAVDVDVDKDYVFVDKEDEEEGRN